MSSFGGGPVTVQVPATSANLGPGFDALGLALSWYDDLAGEVAGGGLDLQIAGEGAHYPHDESNLVVRAMRAAFDVMGAQPPGLRLRFTNRIPHGRGLGSSAAAIVGGIVLARALVADGTARLPDGAALQLANGIEGHPDNVAPALLGGLTIAWLDESGQADAVRLDVDRRVRPVALVPPFTASTQQARGLLPDSVPHRDAALSAGRAALLVAALTGAPNLLLPATEDRLHQQYRLPVLRRSVELMLRLRADGLAAVVSGAGPTVLVLAADDDQRARARALCPPGWRGLELEVAASGARPTTA